MLTTMNFQPETGAGRDDTGSTQVAGQRSRTVLEPVAAMVGAVADDDAHAFVDAVERFIGGPVTLLDAHTDLVASSGPEERTGAPARPRTMIIEIEGEVAGTLELPASGWWGADQEHLLRALARILLARRSLTAHAHDLQHRVALSDWLTAPRNADLTSRPAATADRWGTVCRPVVISVATTDSAPPGTVHQRLREACSREPALRTMALVPGAGGFLVVYPEGSRQPRAQALLWQGVLDRSGVRGLAVSVGRTARAGSELRASLSAAWTVAHLQRQGISSLELPRIAVSEELGPVADVLTAVSTQHVPLFVERVLGDLLTDDRFGGQLVETLHAYLTTGGSPQGAGRLLHLHPSSVKYRIRTVRERLGSRLDDPLQRFDLELAVRLCLAVKELGASSRGAVGSSPAAAHQA